MTPTSVSSYGIIPLKQGHNGWECFLVQHRKNLFWGFPKGHADPGEAPLRTAERELLEETGLHLLRVLDPTPLIERYTYQEEQKTFNKTVYFYLALVSGQERIDTGELLQGKWLTLNEAKRTITYVEGQQLVSALIERLSSSLE